MADMRRMDMRAGSGGYDSRRQTMPATGVGWGGHTISKSFTQLNWEKDPDTFHAQKARAIDDTMMKEKYVGTGQPATRRYSSGDGLRSDRFGMQPDMTMQRAREMVSRNHTISGHNPTEHRDHEQKSNRQVTMEPGSLRKWDAVQLAQNGPLQRDPRTRISVHETGSKQFGSHRSDQRLYTQSISYSAGEREQNMAPPLARDDLQRDSRRFNEPQTMPRNEPMTRQMVPQQQYATYAGNRTDDRNQTTQHTVTVRRYQNTTEDSTDRDRLRNMPRYDADTSQSTYKREAMPGVSPQNDPRMHTLNLPFSSYVDGKMDIPKQTTIPGTIPREDMLRQPTKSTTTLNNIELYVYDYIRRFKPQSLNTVKQRGDVKETVSLQFEADRLSLAETNKESAIALIHDMRNKLVVEKVEPRRTTDLKKLEEELKVIVLPTNNNTLEIVCERQDLERVKNYISNTREDVVHETRQTGMANFAPIPRRDISYNVGSSATLDIRSRFYPKGYLVYGMVKVYLHVCDITTMYVDAIVNAANQHLQHRAGVAKSIADAAGPELDKACQQIIQRGGPIPVAQVVHTPAGQLPCTTVLHAVGPQWPQADHYQQEQCLRHLRQVYDNVVGFAFQSGIETIAIPPISSGAYGVPHGHIIESIYGAVITGVLNYFFHEENNLKELHIVDIRPDLLEKLNNLFDSGCEEQGTPVLRHIADSNTLNAITESQKPRERHFPPVHFMTSGNQTAELNMQPLNPHENDNHNDFLPKGYLVLGMFRVFIHTYDITRLGVDTIVRPTDKELTYSTGLSQSIAAAAGPEMATSIDDILQKQGSMPVSNVVSTSSGRLPCHAILHVVVPEWSYQEDSYMQERCLDDLRRAFDNVVDYACRSGIESMAIPVDPGMFNVPPHHIAAALYDSLVLRLREHFFSYSSLKEIHIVDVELDMLQRFVRLFENDLNKSDARGALITGLDSRVVRDGIYKTTEETPGDKYTEPYRPPDWSQDRGDVERESIMRRKEHTLSRDPVAQWGPDEGDRKYTGEVDTQPDKRKKGKKVRVKKRSSGPLSCCVQGEKEPQHQISVIEHPHLEEHGGQPNRPSSRPNNTDHTHAYDGPYRDSQLYGVRTPQGNQDPYNQRLPQDRSTSNPYDSSVNRRSYDTRYYENHRQSSPPY